jgi:hypothetical protein
MYVSMGALPVPVAAGCFRRPHPFARCTLHFPVFVTIGRSLRAAVRVILGADASSIRSALKHVWYVIVNGDAAYDVLKSSEQLRREGCGNDIDTGKSTRSVVSDVLQRTHTHTQEHSRRQ